MHNETRWPYVVRSTAFLLNSSFQLANFHFHVALMFQLSRLTYPKREQFTDHQRILMAFKCYVFNVSYV